MNGQWRPIIPSTELAGEATATVLALAIQPPTAATSIPAAAATTSVSA